MRDCCVLSLLLLGSATAGSYTSVPAFLASSHDLTRSGQNAGNAPLMMSPSDNNGENTKSNGFNPFTEVMDMFSNMDDIVDDFFNKRMGKGEIFYGKRKYKPSGTVEGKYNGFGLSDKQRIDDTREYRDAMMEERRFRQELAEIQREKELKQQQQRNQN